MKNNKTPQNKFMKIITMPIRALAKARDFYVRSMNNYADKACYGGAPAYADPLPRSFSTTSIRSNDNDDFKELVRAASTSTLGNRINLKNSGLTTTTTTTTTTDHNGKEMMSTSKGGRENNLNGLKGVPRSASVGMAKIEEDKPIEFDDTIIDGGNRKNVSAKNVKHTKFGIFPRSRSYAVGATKRTSAVF